MGRLQKKKEPGKKKIKKDVSDSSGAAPASNSSVDSTRRPPAFVKKSAPAAKAATVRKDPNFIQKSIQFLREVKIELTKVTWPNRKQTMGSTAVVIVLVIIISLFLGLVDFSLSSLIRAVLQ